LPDEAEKRQGKIPAAFNEQTIIAAEEELTKIVTWKRSFAGTHDRSIAELNKEQRQCVTLFYLEKKSYRKLPKIPVTMLQVKSYIQNGKRN